jgi:hypothetical protein
MPSSPGFNTGLGYVQEAIAEAQRKAEAAKSFAPGATLNYLNWKPGDKKIVRFLTDKVITEDFATFILDKTGSTKNFMIDPADPHRLDRYRSPVPGIGWQKEYKTNALKEPYYTKQTACVAVLRDEVMGSNGLEVIDYIYERDLTDKDGNVTATVPSRYFGVVLQNTASFWQALANSCFTRFGTICDHDYLIERLNIPGAARYSHIPIEPKDPDLASEAAVQAFYFYGQPWNAEDPDRFLKCPQTCPEWAQYYSSEDRYKFWLVPDGSTGRGATNPTTSQTSKGLDFSRLGQPAVVPSAPPSPGAPLGSLGEFHKDTTSNPASTADEAQVPQQPSAMPTSGEQFAHLKSTLSETLLRSAEEQK